MAANYALHEIAEMAGCDVDEVVKALRRRQLADREPVSVILWLSARLLKIENRLRRRKGIKSAIISTRYSRHHATFGGKVRGKFRLKRFKTIDQGWNQG